MKFSLGWYGPKNQQNKTDKFLSFFGVMYVIGNSQKDKGKAFKKHVMKNIMPRGFDARIEEIQEKHRQDITDRDNQIQALEFRNEEERQSRQQQILILNEEHRQSIKEKERLMTSKNRHVARHGSFDNVLCFIKMLYYYYYYYYYLYFKFVQNS